MIGDKANLEASVKAVSANTFKQAFHRYAIINLLGKWVKGEADMPPADMNTVMLPSFDMYIRLTPARKGMYSDKPYKLYSQLFEESRLLVKDWDELVRISKEDSKTGRIVAFLLEYTNLCPEIFLLAYNNFGAIIPVGFDTMKYVRAVTGDGWKSEPCFTTKEDMSAVLQFEAMRDVGKKENDNYRKKREREEKRR